MINNIRCRNRNGGLITTEGVVSALGTRLAGSCNYNILFVCRGQNKLCLVGTNILVKFMNVLAMGSHRNNFMIWTYNNNHKPVWRQYQYVRMHIGVNLWGLRPSWSTVRNIIQHFYAGSQPQSARTHVAVKSELEPASIITLQHNTTGRIWLALCTLRNF